MKRLLFILTFLLLLYGSVDAQKYSKRKLYKVANKAFDKGQFNKALSLFLQYDSLYPENTYVKYGIGTCYLNAKTQREKALPYIEYAIKKKHRKIPALIYKQVGNLYYKRGQLSKAKEMYTEFLKKEKDVVIDRKLKKIQFRQKLIQDSLKAKVHNLGYPVNTLSSEISPYISCDGSTMFYQERESGKIFVVCNKMGQWLCKKEVLLPPLDTFSMVKLAGVSPIGDKMFLALGNENTDLYTVDVKGNVCSGLSSLGDNINSEYDEITASLSIDGLHLYFASNRPGGVGLYDIYVSEKDSSGAWKKAQNIGARINTKRNEKYPFLDANMNVLYFSSDGYEAVGGYDVFKSSLKGSMWTKPKNLGCPVNTEVNDLGFSLTVDMDFAYFSSSMEDIALHYDIYELNILEKPKGGLTLMKGNIKAGIPMEPIFAKMKVFDYETNEQQKYVYHSNPATGNYLMLFPSAKRYNMYLEPENYNNYVIDFFVPDQKIFYENFQDIYIKPMHINADGQIVSEEITVNNHFYDLDKLGSKKDSIIHSETYSKLLDLVGTIMQKTDSIGIKALNIYPTQTNDTKPHVSATRPQSTYNQLFEIIEQAIETTNPSVLEYLSEHALPDNPVYTKYTYKGKGYDATVLGRDTIQDIRINDTIGKVSYVSENAIKSIKHITVFFDKSSAKLPDNSHVLLDKISGLLNENSELFIKLKLHVCNEESASVANERIDNLVNYFLDKGVDSERIIVQNQVIKGVSAKENPNADIYIVYPEPDNDTNLVPLCRFNKGEEYRVQILIGTRHLFKDNTLFKGEKVSYYTQGKILRYVIDKPFCDASSAKQYQDLMRKKGFKGAFVVKFINGERLD